VKLGNTPTVLRYHFFIHKIKITMILSLKSGYEGRGNNADKASQCLPPELHKNSYYSLCLQYVGNDCLKYRFM
jgi:hypothetical protein